VEGGVGADGFDEAQHEHAEACVKINLCQYASGDFERFYIIAGAVFHISSG
jgi:hypothetical protein